VKSGVVQGSTYTECALRLQSCNTVCTLNIAQRDTLHAQ
jgi:hypothetical protein